MVFLPGKPYHQTPFSRYLLMQYYENYRLSTNSMLQVFKFRFDNSWLRGLATICLYVYINTYQLFINQLPTRDKKISVRDHGDQCQSWRERGGSMIFLYSDARNPKTHLAAFQEKEIARETIRSHGISFSLDNAPT